MGGKYIYLICFGVTCKKIFLRLLTEQNKIILKKLRYTRSQVTPVDCSPPKFTPCLRLRVQTDTLFKTLNS